MQFPVSMVLTCHVVVNFYDMNTDLQNINQEIALLRSMFEHLMLRAQAYPGEPERIQGGLVRLKRVEEHLRAHPEAAKDWKPYV